MKKKKKRRRRKGVVVERSGEPEECVWLCECLMSDGAKQPLNYRCRRGEIFMKTLLSHSKISQTTSDMT